ncbi:MAG: energy-coupling factor transport system substrate-specific component [Thermoleophilaceae bacterium]|nr:energy-coupling factor transport system substrate-specific component [Thermoleophilaceae bacterium]
MTWQAASILVLVGALGAGFGWYERSRPPSRVLALVASLAALAVVGRLVFAPLPNVKPATTDVILFAGFALGSAPGFATGAIAAFVSNFFFEQGAWTPWQMAAWALVGVGGGVLARVAGRDLGRWPLAIACAVAGLGFGAVMDTFQWTLAARQDLPTWIAVSGQSLPFNLAHAIGNFAFCLVLGPAFVRSLQRFRRRFEFRWAASSATAAGAVLAVVAVAAGLAAPGRADASVASGALSYLVGAQNGDGGFGAARGGSSSQSNTAWAALGMAAAGRSPNEAGPGGHSAVDYMRAHAGDLNDTGELERTILTLHAGAVSPRQFAGRNLVKELLSRQRGNGSFSGLVNHTAFAVLALRAAAAGNGPIRAATRWLAHQHASDGGFGFSPGAAGDVDDTGAAIQALVAGGSGGSGVVKRAVKFLRHAQRSDGGFGQYPESSSNAQSTAWAVQGLVAAGRSLDGVRRNGHTPLGYIKSLARGDGSIRYSRSSSQTPVWVTSQALTALKRKPFPITSVKAVHAGTGGDGSGAGAAHGKGKRRGGAGARAAADRGVIPVGPSAGDAASTRSLRRASEHVGDSSDAALSPAAILLLSGAAFLLLAGASGWRYRRVARRREAL